MEHTRQALKDIGTNSPSVKRQKLNNNSSHQNQNQHQHKHERQAITESLKEWRKSWLAAMREAVIYFDSNDLASTDYSSIKKREKEKAMKLFTQVGATIQKFYDNKVTIVVSRRDKSDLPQNMLQDTRLKIWNYEKVFRFLKNLGEIPSPVQPKTQNKHLSSLLHDEKLYGPNDRDPSAKRDDFNYFKNQYFFVYDLRQVTRPIAVREWKNKDPKKPYPHLYASSYGRSPFIPDPADSTLPKKIQRRKIRDEQNRRYRDKLRVIYNEAEGRVFGDPFSDFSEGESDSTLYDRENVDTMPPPAKLEQQGVPDLTRQASLISNKFMEVTKRDNYEIQASGYNGSTNVSQQSTEVQTKNGLAPTGSSVASKQVNSLTKKLIFKKQQKANIEQAQRSKQKVPGYCENCRVHFDDFDEHIKCNKHRSFAIEDSNFSDIDNLIGKLNDNIAFKT
ncbi:Hsk1-interacting molecule 1 [Wickerhamomyces ciferrii]|uniref:Hsk1-interacting molecule 1 n=1 Tax=Wickerhamomyces ciferrii (strain ATCC 14091 / BCRC 22168 / CBS 111 / JCM 3599 / NBRC 0793 / NRRL Y-1031 F-60-10) TaxID=1206466 RepID=K0KG51_WICCF|nr:Hsk1-interacting molecule 1 [Wickerhamomyces ciferrii]CCH44135.1 Hsk1-interacting molecule 1 [Wickerhamomyces ciferrii]